MRIIIHRGIDQIGGCITEISTSRSKIIIDLGMNLPRGNMPTEDMMDDDETIAAICKDCDAIFYTHYHGDHVGLFRHVPADTVQYIGPLAKEVLLTKMRHMALVPEQKEQRMADMAMLERFRTFEAASMILAGEDIRVTPFFVSHSAADAYMFLIEADGKRVLHTGDFRQHGYLGKGLFPTLDKYIGTEGIDALICEGTMLNRKDGDVVHENTLKQRAIRLMQQYRYVFVMCSSTDPDRLATLHQANRAMRNRPLVCDTYQKQLLDLFTRTYGAKSDLYKFGHKVYAGEHINDKLRHWMTDQGFTMLLRSGRKFQNMAKTLLADLNPDETLLVYSMFDGYVTPGDEAFNSDLAAFVNMFPHVEHLHTSGHATKSTLERICNSLMPRQAIIPIHKERNSDFGALSINETLRSRIVTESKVLDGLEIIIK